GVGEIGVRGGRYKTRREGGRMQAIQRYAAAQGPRDSGKIGRRNGGKKNVTWKLPDIEKTANACSQRSIPDRLIGGISSLPPLALPGSLCVTSHLSPVFLLVATLSRGAGTRAISDNFNGAVYRVTCDGASVDRWFIDIALIPRASKRGPPNNGNLPRATQKNARSRFESAGAARHERACRASRGRPRSREAIGSSWGLQMRGSRK